MKTKTTILLALLALGTSTLLVSAQDNHPSNDGPPQGGGQGQRGPGMGQHPSLPAVVRALDANHDGVVDADEIANASAALKTLDKNNDGNLTMQELMGPRPQMRGGKGQGRGPGGPGGPGGEDNMPPNGPPPADGNGPSGPPPGDQ